MRYVKCLVQIDHKSPVTCFVCEPKQLMYTCFVPQLALNIKDMFPYN